MSSNLLPLLAPTTRTTRGVLKSAVPRWAQQRQGRWRTAPAAGS
ncbi:hypothetical protein [Nocardia iowensis]|nr:hypothetical protein [Nocardia iowensis]